MTTTVNPFVSPPRRPAVNRKISRLRLEDMHPAAVTPADVARQLERLGYPKLATFTEDGLGLVLSTDAPVTASPAERTIEGIIVPFGPAGRTSGGLLTFGPGSLKWSDPKRVKLLVEHDQGRAVGYALELEERPEGLWGKFHVPEGPDGDLVLSQAANGVRDAFSVGVMLDASVEHNLRRAQGQAVKGTGQLRETSMVSVPAFDDARVGSVAASTHRLVVSAWADETPTEGEGMNRKQRERMAHLRGLAALSDTERTELSQLEALATASTDTDTDTGSSSSSSSSSTTTSSASSTANSSAGSTTSGSAEGTTTASSGPARIAAAAGSAVTVASEPATYTLNGDGPSLVRDAYRARMEGDGEAAERVRRFNAELAGNNPSSVLALAAVETTTGDAAPFAPTTHRPDLMRAMIDRARPLISRVNTVPLTSANPFSIPAAGEFDGVDEHTEGTAHNPEGDLILDGGTVTPRAASGAYRISRELIDSSNPILDRVAMRKMLKDYRRHTESKFYNALVAGEVNVIGVDTVAELDTQLDLFINDDEETADFAAVAPTLLTTLKGDVDGSGRPHLARYYPSNATAELSGSRTGVVAVFGDTPLVRAGSVAANTGLIVREAGVMWAESKVQQFSFSEVEGPGIVKLALWAYTAAARLDDNDVVALTSAAV